MCKTTRIAIMLAASVASAGCGNREADGARTDAAAGASVAPGGTVSPEQARAAQLLSLSGNGTTEQRTGYAGALECAASLALFVETVEGSPLIDQAQADALRRARGLFRERAEAAGKAEGRTPQGIEADITRTADNAADDPAKSSRTAIACIRQLAGQAS